MNKKRNKFHGDFDPMAIKSWEDSDGVNFAIALGRITGWLLHVDWWTPDEIEEDVTKMKSLRVYVGDNHDNIFDVQGRFKLNTFNIKIIKPLAKARGKNYGGVRTKYYAEEKLFNLPLRIKPDIAKIMLCEKAIQSNMEYMAKISLRQKPYIPANIAANYTFGKCAVYATALQKHTHFIATAMIAIEYKEQFSLSKKGYVHSFVLHPDGSAIDIWGKQTIESIAERFGILKYILDEKGHLTVDENLRANSPEKYQKSYEEAESLIKEFYINT